MVGPFRYVVLGRKGWGARLSASVDPGVQPVDGRWHRVWVSIRATALCTFLNIRKPTARKKGIIGKPPGKTSTTLESKKKQGRLVGREEKESTGGRGGRRIREGGGYRARTKIREDRAGRGYLQGGR